MSTLRLWKFISYSDEWQNLDTSILDEIAPSWFSRREILLANSKEYEEFINRLKRRHAIETGIVERMYDIDKGVTETLINEGFLSSLISHNDTNIEKTTLLNHLQDHLDAVDLVFDIVKDNRPLTKGFICELHQLTTRHQDYAEGRDQFGNKTKINLNKGRFKERENNPTREDGTVIMYCPPEHVDAEMDKLIEIYSDLSTKGVHPLIIAAWVHHAFTTIHPFQDGNGRVIRLIASLILVKHNYFPVTVLREEAKVKYIEALENADNGEPQLLVNYFAEIQRRNIEEALNLKEVSSTSLSEVTNILKTKIEKKRAERKADYEAELENRRMSIFRFCNVILNNFKRQLETDFGESIQLYIDSGRPNDATKQGFYYKQIVNYAKTHHYFFNSNLPKSYFILGIDMHEGKKYKLGVSIHHYGYEDNTIAIGGFLEYESSTSNGNDEITIPLDIKPHIISINDDVTSKEKNIQIYLENILTIAIAQIASEF
jgi:Fic family protein